MGSYFEEIGALDRPYLDFKLNIKGQEVPLWIRQPSSLENDSMDAGEMDEYGKLIAEAYSKKNGGLSEFDRKKSLFETQPASDIANQLVMTRMDQVREIVRQEANFDIDAHEAYLESLETDEDKNKYTDSENKRLEGIESEARKQVSQMIQSEMLFDEMVERLTKITINLNCQTIARRATNAEFLFSTLYRPDDTETKAFESVEQVKKTWTSERINSTAIAVRTALNAGDSDLPKELPTDQEPSEPTPSPSDSEEVLEDSGTPTKAHKVNSKSSGKRP